MSDIPLLGGPQTQRSHPTAVRSRIHQGALSPGEGSRKQVLPSVPRWPLHGLLISLLTCHWGMPGRRGGHAWGQKDEQAPHGHPHLL